jgi:hypothetical protein
MADYHPKDRRAIAAAHYPPLTLSNTSRTLVG